MKELKSFNKNLKRLSESILLLDRRMVAMSKTVQSLQSSMLRMRTEQTYPVRAKTEQSTEQTEQSLVGDMSRIIGKHREVLAILINDGYSTYEQIAGRLNISQSRARAYVAELAANHSVPLRKIKDPEGLKIGLDVNFVEKILAFK